MPALCRDCLAVVDGQASAVRCASCDGTRIVRHAELFDLTIAHIDCDGPDAHDASRIPARAAAGDALARAALDRHADRLARGLAQVINLLDPDVIVLGGGLSKMDHLYTALPPLVRRRVFSDFVVTPILSNRHGDSSGVRGAAWLWPAEA